MLKIDIHTHILPKELPDFSKKYGYEGFVHLEHHKPCCARMMIGDKFFREIESNCWDPQTRIKEYDTFDVQVQVLSTVPVMFAYWAKPEDGHDLAKYLNDHIAQVVKENPKRFVGLGTLPLQDPKRAVRELERCVKELGLAGVQIGSHVNDWNLDAPELFEVFEAAQQFNAAIFVHPWDMMGQKRMPKYWLPWLVGMPAEVSLAICSFIFGGIFERLPKLRVAFAHGGGAFPATLGRIGHGFDVRPDLCAVDNNVHPMEYLNRIFVDSLVHDKLTLQYLIERLGTKQIALGTDYPFPLGELHPGKLIQEMGLSKDDMATLLHGSALRWLGLNKTDFN